MEPRKISVNAIRHQRCVTIDGYLDETHNMRAVVRPYKPQVVCLDHTISPDIRESCQGLLDTMPVDTTRRTFGYNAVSKVRMPYRRISGEPFLPPFGPFIRVLMIGQRMGCVSWKLIPTVYVPRYRRGEICGK